MKVNIRCKQVMHFDQEVDMSPEDYEILKNCDEYDISERHNSKEFNIVQGHIDFMDILDSDREFTDLEVTEVKPKKKQIR